MFLVEPPDTYQPAGVERGTTTSTSTTTGTTSAHYQVEVDGRWKRFSSKGWFYVGQSVAGCPGCRLVLEAFRHPYVTSAGVQYHYWALVCLKCRAAWPPSDLDGDGRKELYKSSEHRPDAITT